MLDWNAHEMHRNAVVSSLKSALERFLLLDKQNKDISAITKARREVEDLTSKLAEIDRPKCKCTLCGDDATWHRCTAHRRVA
jgi:hypothetical protein